MSEQNEDTSSDSIAEGIRVFVYGTLKRGYGNHYALETAEFLGECEVGDGDLTMIDMGWYPGVVQSKAVEGGKVKGEVFLVDEPTLHVLDLIEGHPHFYERKKIDTPWKKAWVYLLPEEYLEDQQDYIPEGEWNGSKH